MHWKKLGNIFLPESKGLYMHSHAANPLPFHLNGDLFRVFYSTRSEANKSSVAFVDVDIKTLEVKNASNNPLIKHGLEGSFYAHGISIGNIYTGLDNKKFILFMGWQNNGEDHWRGDVGRLELIGTDKINVNPEGPFLEADIEDPISLSYPFVIFHEGIYKMWYGSTITWEAENGEMLHVIKYATSNDGENWTKHGVAIPYEIGVAQAFSKPSVIVDDNGFHMWFSYRDGTGKKYRIGYAKSENGLNWDRKLDEVGIDVSEKGWDSEMICYPFVFDHDGKRFMLYNGNGYGKTGFGLAILDKWN